MGFPDRIELALLFSTGTVQILAQGRQNFLPKENCKRNFKKDGQKIRAIGISSDGEYMITAGYSKTEKTHQHLLSLYKLIEGEELPEKISEIEFDTTAPMSK